MALINCTECGKEISDRALACPNCGCPLVSLSVEENTEISIQEIIESCNRDKEASIKKYLQIEKDAGWDGDFGESLYSEKHMTAVKRYVERALSDKEYHNSIVIAKKCKVCNNVIALFSESCPKCGKQFGRFCPKCHSPHIEKIGGLTKGVSIGLFGGFAANTVLNDYKCLICGNKFK